MNAFASFPDPPKALPLKGAIQHYDWGGDSFLPELIGQPNPTGEPWAELWMGAHPKAPSQVLFQEKWVPLNEVIAAFPTEMLGQPTYDQFKGLPFLFKVLDVRDMLSIQSHPTLEVARAGFEKEEAAGIPLSAYHRTFKDPNHKPEVMIALSDFWLLHGFRSTNEIESFLDSSPVLKEAKDLYHGDTRALYQYFMTLDQEKVNQMLDALLRPYEETFRQGTLPKEQPAYWAMKAKETHFNDGNYDRGTFSIFLLNLVHLPKGQGIFQGAGIPHAYLEGVNVELMANSDNVFRGGLTTKYVDLEALMANLVFDPVIPQRLGMENYPEGEFILDSPVPDFQLSHLRLMPGAPFDNQSKGPEIYIVLAGEVVVDSGGGSLTRGSCFFIPAGTNYNIRTLKDATLFRANVNIQ